MKQPNMGQLMKQAQKMQEEMVKVQDQLERETVEASVGGGSVTVTMTGRFEVTKVKIDPAAIDPDDAEMLEDLVLAAYNEALRQAQTLAEQRISSVTGGLGMPGLM